MATLPSPPSKHWFKNLSKSYIERLNNISQSLHTAKDRGVPMKLSTEEMEYVMKCFFIEAHLQTEFDNVGAGAIVDVSGLWMEMFRLVANATNIDDLKTMLLNNGVTRLPYPTPSYYKVVVTSVCKNSHNNPLSEVFTFVDEMYAEERPALVNGLFAWIDKKTRWMKQFKPLPSMVVTIVLGLFGLAAVLLDHVLKYFNL